MKNASSKMTVHFYVKLKASNLVKEEFYEQLADILFGKRAGHYFSKASARDWFSGRTVPTGAQGWQINSSLAAHRSLSTGAAAAFD